MERRTGFDDALQFLKEQSEENYTAFWIQPERRQRVHIRMRLAAPFTRALTVRRFGRNTRLVRLLA